MEKANMKGAKAMDIKETIDKTVDKIKNLINPR